MSDSASGKNDPIAGQDSAPDEASSRDELDELLGLSKSKAKTLAPPPLLRASKPSDDADSPKKVGDFLRKEEPVAEPETKPELEQEVEPESEENIEGSEGAIAEVAAAPTQGEALDSEFDLFEDAADVNLLPQGNGEPLLNDEDRFFSNNPYDDQIFLDAEDRIIFQQEEETEGEESEEAEASEPESIESPRSPDIETLAIPLAIDDEDDDDLGEVTESNAEVIHDELEEAEESAESVPAFAPPSEPDEELTEISASQEEGQEEETSDSAEDSSDEKEEQEDRAEVKEAESAEKEEEPESDELPTDQEEAPKTSSPDEVEEAASPIAVAPRDLKDETAPEENEIAEQLQAVDLDSAGQSRKRSPWNLFTGFFTISTLLLAALLGVCGYLAWEKRGDLAVKALSQAESSLRDNLSEKGIYLEYESWDYEFPRGILLKNARIYRSEARKLPVIDFSNIGLDLDLKALARRSASKGEQNAASSQDPGAGSNSAASTAEEVRARISFERSEVTLYDTAGAPLTKINAVDGEFIKEEGGIFTKRIEGNLGGLRLDLAGYYLPAQASEPVVDPSAEQSPIAANSSPFADLDFSMLTAILPWIAMQIDANERTIPPELKGDFAVDFSVPEAVHMSLSGILDGENFLWRGIPIRSAMVPVRFSLSSDSLDFPDFQLGYGEGLVTGSIQIEGESGAIVLKDLQTSQVDPLEIASHFQPKIGDALSRVDWIEPPYTKINGRIPLEEPASAALDIEVNAPAGMLLQISDLEKKWPFTSLHGDLKIKDGTIDSREFRGELLGAPIWANCILDLKDENLPFNGLLEVSDLQLEALSPYLGTGNVDYAGTIALSYRGTGSRDFNELRGGGNFRITEGKMDRIPAIGQVHRLASALVPMFAFRDYSDLRATYLIESGTLLSNDLTIIGDSTQILTNGNLNLKTKEIAFQSTAGLFGPLASLMQLEGEGIKIQGKGSLNKPSIAIREFPPGFASDEAKAHLGVPTTGPIANAIAKLLGQGSEGGGPPALDSEGNALPQVGGALFPAETRPAVVDESIISIFREGSEDLQGILDGIAQPAPGSQ